MVKFTHKDFKSILNVRKHIDSWFWGKYGINPYNGCQHDCIYCDSRSERYYLPGNFESDIVIKNNIRSQLDKRISNARSMLPDVTGLGGTTDPYQQAEIAFKNSRQCLEVLNKYGYPVHIITKSDLVLRDLDLLGSIGRRNWCAVSLTITSPDAITAAFSEAAAPTPEKRFQLISTIKKKEPSVLSGVLFMPVLPGLTDSYETIGEMISLSKKAGADYILFGGALTMRDRQAIWFLEKLEKQYPELIPLYEKLYAFSYTSGSYTGQYGANHSYNHRITEWFLELCRKHDIRYRIPRFIPSDFRKYNYMLSEIILNRAYLLQMTGRNYKDALWAGLNIQALQENIVTIMKRGELRKIGNVDSRIEEYIKKFLHERKAADDPCLPYQDIQSPTLF